MDEEHDKEFDSVPLSESNVSIKLAAIQRRCSEMLAEPDALIELSLEDSEDEADINNPYSRG